MIAEEPLCRKCRTAMDPGFVLDQTYGAMTQSAWIEGAHARSFWTGVKIKGRGALPDHDVPVFELWVSGVVCAAAGLTYVAADRANDMLAALAIMRSPAAERWR